MAQPPTRSVREVLLETVRDRHAKLNGGTLQQGEILQEVSRILIQRQRDPEMEEAILTEWYDLFRTGLLAWGFNLNNPNPPWFHITERGRGALATVARDPSNPAGYLRHIETLEVPLGSTAKSYVVEAVDCYVAGLFKAAAVMIGAAAEARILEIRDMVVATFEQGKQTPPPRGLTDYRIKTVTDALGLVFQGIDKKTHRALREKFDAHWGGLTHEIRTTRNDAGHPASIDPVTPESVHASLLMFPVLADLTGDLLQWVADDF